MKPVKVILKNKQPTVFAEDINRLDYIFYLKDDKTNCITHVLIELRTSSDRPLVWQSLFPQECTGTESAHTNLTSAVKYSPIGYSVYAIKQTEL